ncbi:MULTISPECIES: hypothetical protein [unclassified Mycobacterium]|uniref:hypothetical protein n=1 Tax=unclassified Mycobacterium TaxID=2642494 RepID=UPI0029C669C6|nr:MULTISPECIES: hypothetical protein [unclassified Mycobacterium]
MKQTVIRASMATVSAIGLLSMPVMAHAMPPLPLAPQCDGIWGFDGESVIFEPDTGWSVTFFSNGKLATGDATASNNRGESKTGSVRGGITDDGRRYNVSVDYDNGQHQLYSGRVSRDGVVTGATNNGITLESGKAFTQRLVCLPA